MAAIDAKDWISIVLGLIGSGGLLGGIYALLKLRPEAGQIAVIAAQGAVVVQQNVIDQLQDENKRLQSRLDAVEAELSKAGNLYLENYKLRLRVTELEREVAELKQNGHT